MKASLNKSTATRLVGCCLLLAASILTPPSFADYAKHPEASDFINTMVIDHQFEREQVTKWLAAAKYQESIVKAMSRPAEKAKPWHEYRKIFVTAARTSRGLDFWEENNATLKRAEREFGVDPAIVVSIIGIETNYGRNTGSYKVIDALTTLAFDYYTYTEKRQSRKVFFTIQLENLLLLAREQNKDPLTLKGSYAGAMGWGQFMPNSYRDYAVDYDGDGFADIWNNPTDAIGSVANYFTKHGWKMGQPVATRAYIGVTPSKEGLNKMTRPTSTIAELTALGYNAVEKYAPESKAFPLRFEGKYAEEYWLGLHNFYVIGRYNPRTKYAMAVYQLSELIRNQFCDSDQHC